MTVSKPAQGGRRHAFVFCIFTLAVVPLSFLSLATAVSCRHRLLTLMPASLSSSSSLPSSGAFDGPKGLGLPTAQETSGVGGIKANTATTRTTTTTNTITAASRRCTLDDYLQGKWQPSERPQVRPGYAFCTIDPRQDCRAYASSDSNANSNGNNNAKAGYLHQRWVPSAPQCALRHLTASQIKRCLRKQSVVFLGDSLARNHQQSLQCMLLEGPEEVARPFFKGSQGTEKATYDSVYPETQTVVKARISSLIAPSDIAKVANDTIVIVGTGSHWNPSAFGFSNLSYASSWSAIAGGEAAAKQIVRAGIRERIEALQALPPSVRVIWRTPDLSHSSAPKSNDPWYHKCAPFEASWDPRRKRLPWDDKLQWIYDAVHEYAAGTRIEVMDVMGMSGQRADGRPSAHLNRTREGIPVHDCLHWCLPGVPDAWNEVLINYLCQEEEEGEEGEREGSLQ